MTIIFENCYLDIFAILASLVVVLISYFKWKYTFWERRGVYTAPPMIPFGNSVDLILQRKSIGLEMEAVYADIKSKGKRFGGYYSITQPIFIPVDIELVKRIFTKDFAHFTNHAEHVNEDVDPLSGHLFALKGERWKELRTKLTPTFSSGKMKMMFPTLVNCTKGLVAVINDSIKNQEVLDIKDIASRFTIDVVGSCGFGIECNSLQNPDSEFTKYGKRIFAGSFHNKMVETIVVMGGEKLLDLLRIPVFEKSIFTFFRNIVRETVAYREENNVIRKDFVHLLIQLKNNVKISENEVGALKNETSSKSETTLTDTEMVAQVFVFFAAGFETSATTTTFCLYELAQNPECQDKLREEINTVLEKYKGELTYDGIMEMHYMEKCIQETLRKYPPVSVHTRECTQTYKVPDSDVVLEKGSVTFISPMGIHHDPEYYPKPEKFDPERFSNENKAARPAGTWIPFGDGPRLCIGMRFGMMQIKVALAVTLKNFKLSVNSKTETPLRLNPKTFVPEALTGIWLNAKKV